MVASSLQNPPSGLPSHYGQDIPLRLCSGNGPLRRSLRTPLWAVNDLNAKLQTALDSTAESLSLLQRQVKSLAQVTLQNQWALDLLTAGKGGTCLFLKEECYYVNESGLEENVHRLANLAESLKRFPANTSTTGLFQSSLLTWLLPILGPYS